ncbi:MAG TPA: hypothetical protein PKE12_03525 [Kiritimatiellia bacterium]|nr:hypothetical protein [Kiritimatiellia bacterium]
MKTTIDIPEPLYKRAKIKALERGETLRQVVLAALANDLDAPGLAVREGSFAQRRILTPAFVAHEAKGSYRTQACQPDITRLISEERDER